jgi:hypothetical protein
MTLSGADAEFDPKEYKERDHLRDISTLLRGRVTPERLVSSEAAMKTIEAAANKWKMDMEDSPLTAGNHETGLNSGILFLHAEYAEDISFYLSKMDERALYEQVEGLSEEDEPPDPDDYY